MKVYGLNIHPEES